MAARGAWLEVAGGRLLNRWTCCATCHQRFTGALGIEMTRRWWRHCRGASVPEDRCPAVTVLACTLVELEEFDVAERLHEEARRDVADDDSLYGQLILPAELQRSGTLIRAGRERDALEILTRLRPRMRRCKPSIRVLYNTRMSMALVGVGRLVDAQQCGADAVQLARATSGPHSLRALEAMFTQAQLLERIGRVEEAKTMVGDVLAAQLRILGPQHERTHQTRDLLRGMVSRTM